VVTLALVVLITTLLLAFFVSSTQNGQLEVSSTGRVETSILARSVLQLIVGDLQKEMLAGSTLIQVQSNRVLQPIAGNTMLPSRVLAESNMSSDTNFNNLVKQSVANAPFFNTNAAPYNNNNVGPGVSPSSSISTLTLSRNNRKLSFARWNLPAFISGPGFDKASQVPSWVYMDKEGITSAPGMNIIGRFAYNIYDEGGLINANVAGFRTGLALGEAPKLKGSPAGAVLQNNIPGILNEVGFIKWRNAYSASDTLSPSGYLDAVLLDTNGFRLPLFDKSNPLTSDNRFVSRQDLIRYVRLNPTVIGTNALPYLTTFSLEKNSPSWGPMTNAPSFAYQTKSTDSGATNRLAPAVFHVAGTQLSEYDRQGTAHSPYIAKASDPVVRKRFPLNRLYWITSGGPFSDATVTISDAATRAVFGLSWDNNAKMWKYLENGNALQGKIKTLAEVATAGRDPNFFELLKAAILSGSLGREAGDGVSANGVYDRNTDYQIIQIGCNIIDQYRKDDIPTQVQFDATTYGTISGVVDLPYINKIYNIMYRPKVGEPVVLMTGAGVQDNDRRVLGGWIVPELWRLHARSALGEDPTGSESIRMRVIKGKLSLSVYATFENSNTYPALYPAIKDMSGEILGFDVDKDSFRQVPDVIRNTPGIVPPYGKIDDSGQFGTLWGMNVGFSAFGQDVLPPDVSEARKRIRGYLRSQPPNPPPNDNYAAVRKAAITPTESVDILMEIDRPGGYVPYDIIKNIKGNIGIAGGQRSVPLMGFIQGNTTSTDWGTAGPDFSNNYIAAQGYATGLYGGMSMANRWSGFALSWAVPIASMGRADPRTDRFGLSSFLGSQMGFLRAPLKGTAGTSYSDPATMPRVPAGTVNYLPTRGGLRAQQVKFAGQFNKGQFTIDAGWLDNHERTASSDPYGDDFVGNYPGSLTDNKPRSDKGGAVYYQDNDGVQRRAWGAYKDYYMNEATRAPIMLNRSFYSAGDLGYAHRGEPWKNLDFYTPESADAGLLDFFTAIDQGEVVEGKININSAPKEVLAAYLQNTVNNEMAGAPAGKLLLDAGQALALATEIQKEVKARGFVNKSELVTRFADAAAIRQLSTGETDYPKLTDNKSTYEVISRGLSDVVQTRTWNLMVDLIAQKGRLAKAADLNSFMVEGERRYWLHVAIDRFTGEIIDQKLEAVYE